MTQYGHCFFYKKTPSYKIGLKILLKVILFLCKITHPFYNLVMEKISFILVAVVIELLVDIIVLRIFKIKYNFIYIMFLQVPKVCALVLFIELKQSAWIKALYLILSQIIVVFFLTDSVKFKKYLEIFFMEYMILFSISGFTMFLTKWFESLYLHYFLKDFPKKWRCLAVFAIFLYIFAFFAIVRNLSKNKKLEHHLTEMSLSFGQRHINVYGLVDSGNSLIDPKTKKPVLVVSLSSILKLMSKKKYQKIVSEQSHFIKCETISSCGFSLPILDNIKVKIKVENELLEVDCVLGVIDKKFENGRYDCLLQRDFL